MTRPRHLQKLFVRALAAMLLVLIGLSCSLGEAGAALEPAAAIGPDPFIQDAARPAPAELLESIDELRAASEAVEDIDVPRAGSETAAGGVAAAEKATELALPVVEAPSPIGVGLYGGTGGNACDVDGMISFFTANTAHASAWADVQGISADEIPVFLQSLTSGWLIIDTEVINHGFKNGSATPRQSVLEAGTAVLVDSSGIPRVRCKCGNPLKPAPSMLEAHQLSGNWTFTLQSSDLPAGIAVASVDIDVVLNECSRNRCTADVTTNAFGDQDLAAKGDGLTNLRAVIPTITQGDCGQPGGGASATGVYDVQRTLIFDSASATPTLIVEEQATLARPGDIPADLQCEQVAVTRSTYGGAPR